VKVLLIYPCEMSVYTGTRFEFKQSQECLPPLNIAVLAGSLVSAGHEVRAIDLQVEADQEAAIREVVSSWRPEMVGISFKTPVYDQARQIAASVRRLAPGVRILGGGVHATNFPEACLSETDMDVIVIGEGDHTIVRIADGQPLSEIADVAYKQDVAILVNRKAGEKPVSGPECDTADLDQLPYPEWSVFDLADYARISRLFYEAPPVGFIETSRGCPARCIFCSKGVFGSTWRRKSPKRVVDEMQRMLDYGFREIEIVDDSFTTDLQRAVAVCEEILRRKLKFPWCCRNGLRVGNVNQDFFRIAAKAGLHLVAFGFETGSSELLAQVKKGATLQRSRQVAQWAKQAGMTVMGYFLMGLPGETEQTLRETIDFACSLEIDYIKYNLVIPLPGTPLSEIWKDRMKLSNWSQYNFHSPARDLYDHPNLDWDTLEAYLSKGYRRFYLRPRYLGQQLLRILRQHRLLVSARTAMQLLKGPRRKA